MAIQLLKTTTNCTITAGQTRLPELAALSIVGIPEPEKSIAPMPRMGDVMFLAPSQPWGDHIQCTATGNTHVVMAKEYTKYLHVPGRCIQWQGSSSRTA